MSDNEQNADKEPVKRPSASEVAEAFCLMWPLVKAAIDPFDYAIGLRSGAVIRFERLTFDKDPFDGKQPTFVTLIGVEEHSIRQHPGVVDIFTFDRGLVVRIDEIVWAADAPRGS